MQTVRLLRLPFSSLYSSSSRNPSITVARACYNSLTGNLTQHVKKCAPKPNAESKAINTFMHGSTYSRSKMRYKLIRWVVRNHRPFAIVEDEDLLDIFKMLYAEVQVPSARTISRDIQEVFLLTRKNVMEMPKVRLIQWLFSKLQLLNSLIGISRKAAYRPRWLDFTECDLVPGDRHVHGA